GQQRAVLVEGQRLDGERVRQRRDLAPRLEVPQQARAVRAPRRQQVAARVEGHGLDACLVLQFAGGFAGGGLPELNNSLSLPGGRGRHSAGGQVTAVGAEG